MVVRHHQSDLAGPVSADTQSFGYAALMRVCLVLNQVRSPANVGVLVRSLVAFGGRQMVFVGHELPWSFKKGSEAFSRGLERQIEIVHLGDESAFFGWCAVQEYLPVALEISDTATPLTAFQFPDDAAIVLGSERAGLTEEFQARCSGTVCIEQFGPVGSLNLGAAGSIALHAYSCQKLERGVSDGRKYVGEAPHTKRR